MRGEWRTHPGDGWEQMFPVWESHLPEWPQRDKLTQEVRPQPRISSSDKIWFKVIGHFLKQQFFKWYVFLKIHHMFIQTSRKVFEMCFGLWTDLREEGRRPLEQICNPPELPWGPSSPSRLPMTDPDAAPLFNSFSAFPSTGSDGHRQGRANTG